MIEEQYKRQREMAQNIQLNMGDINQNYQQKKIMALTK